jgi:RsiW-degrading membrane proteinase PrsW (M82 family)
MRPGTIVNFERLMVGTIATAWLQMTLNWNEMIRELSPAMSSPASFLIIMMAVMTALYLLLTLFVSRRRSKIAMWILIVLFVIGIPSFVRALRGGRLIDSPILTIVPELGQLIALILLFLPASRAWFRREDEKPDLQSTFS